MTALSTLLTDAADGIELPALSDATIAADVTRGRRALARRRAGRVAARGSLVLGVTAAVAFGAVSFIQAPVSKTPPTTTAAAGARLVAYTGVQPNAFIVDTVPAGWTILRADSSSLIIGPKGSAITGGGTSGGITQPVSVPTVGLYVSLAPGTAAADALPGSTPVTVGDSEGFWGSYQGGSHELTFPAPGRTVEVQVPQNLHWSASQAATFASGLHLPTHPSNTNG